MIKFLQAFLHRCTWAFAIFLFFFSCKEKVTTTSDELYSRHLQKRVQLKVIRTKTPPDKKTFNLLLLNDGQDITKLDIEKIVDSLYSKKAIQPLIVVGIEAFDRQQIYGVVGYADYANNGVQAEKYETFIENELLPFIKKMTGIRKFHSTAIAGFSLGGVSALDFAWDHGDKIDKVGVFSGSFWLRDKEATAPDYSDEKDRIMINKIRSSRKRPKLRYWFYAGGSEETADRDKDGIIDVVDDTRDVIAQLKMKNAVSPNDITYTELKEGIHDYSTWKNKFPQFLVWAFGK